MPLSWPGVGRPALCLLAKGAILLLFSVYALWRLPVCSTGYFEKALKYPAMSIPLFPSLRPNIVSPFWCDLDPPIDEEAEILELEREQREWVNSEVLYCP